MADYLTIRGAVARAKQEGLPVTEYTLRNWIKAGEVPAIYAGNKAILFYPNIVRYLKGGANVDPAT